MPGRAGQGRIKVEIVCGWGGVAWRGVGFGRVGKGGVGLGLGVGEGVYMELGKVGSVGMWVSPLKTPTSPLPFPLLHDPILLARVC